MMRESGLLPLPDWWFSLFYTISNLGFTFLNLVGVAAMVVRFRRSVGDERLQMKWLAYFLATAIAIQMFFFQIPGAFFNPQVWETLWFDLLLWAIFLGFPVYLLNIRRRKSSRKVCPDKLLVRCNLPGR